MRTVSLPMDPIHRSIARMMILFSPGCCDQIYLTAPFLPAQIRNHDAAFHIAVAFLKNNVKALIAYLMISTVWLDGVSSDRLIERWYCFFRLMRIGMDEYIDHFATCFWARSFSAQAAA
jgi:hypothetical protein